MPRNTLTYPISPDYVKSWTPSRALAELIANALDEDPHATAVWSDGVLTIEDQGAGIPEEGMILGYSPKDDTNIGQFGEGAKIASLVLARAEGIGQVRVETVGYGFVPTVETRHILDGIAPRRNATPPQVLVYTFTRSHRDRGTKVTVECPRQVAAEAIGRFRHLTEPGYTPPTQPQVILEGTPGRLFIGGVLVSTQPRFLASYDFPLAVAKTAQNRDRTVIDADVLTTMVTDALAGCADETVVERFAQAAVDGKRFSEPEKYFTHVSDPRVAAAFRAVGRAMFAGRDVFYTLNDLDESALDLSDGSFEHVTTNLDLHSHHQLMRLLGVPRPKVAAARNATRSERRTKYVARTKLTAAEKKVLDEAIDTVRAVYGASALAEVKVFTETQNPALTCADGFYSPASKAVAILRAVLTDPARTLEVLLHEAAHRRAHLAGREHADRTRGFESELTVMLGAAVAALRAARHQVPAVDGAADGEPAGPVIEEVTAPTVRRELAALIEDALPAALDRAGVAGARELMDACALHRNYLRLLTAPRPVGWRQRRGNMTPSMVSDYDKLEVLGGALGVRPAVLWLGHVLCEGPRYGRANAQARPGAWSRRMLDMVERAAAELAGYGGAYAAAVPRLRAYAAGEADSCGDVEEWTGFAVELLAVERERLGLTGTRDAEAACEPT